MSEKTEIMKEENTFGFDKIDCLANHDIRQSHPSAGLLTNREPVHRLDRRQPLKLRYNSINMINET